MPAQEATLTEYRAVFSIVQAAELVGLSHKTVLRAIARGDLQAAQLGRQYRISRISLERWWQEKGGGPLFEPAPPQADTEGAADA